MPRRELELLAPARDAAIGIEAINHGADAVYIGGPGFGARDKAPNRIEDIERLCRHARGYGARIFVTLNTILRDDELDTARRMAWDCFHAGVDALIVQDMALLDLDLPPIQLHASTQCDTRTPAKARFLQDVGFSQVVLARELDLRQIHAIREGLAGAPDGREAVLEFFVHGALCVAYSGQCWISHAHTGRSANRGSCSQECRLPYTVLDGQGRVVAHDKHVLSLKDNDQSANLAALVDVGIRSFKIEGRYKDMATVKNLTAHWRQLIDGVLETRPDLLPASSGRCTFTFTPDPERAFNRGATDYFVNGRQIDIGAFDTPKHAGVPFGTVLAVGPGHMDVALDDPADRLHNGDSLTWFDLQGELQGVPVNVATPLSPGRWRGELQLPQGASTADLKDLRRGTALHRNRDMAWERRLAAPSADRRIGVSMQLVELPHGFGLTITDADGHTGWAEVDQPHAPAKDAAKAEATAREQLARLGSTRFAADDIGLGWSRPWFVPASALNALRRDAVAALEQARADAWTPLPRWQAVAPPVPYPDTVLTYAANVHNHVAAAFYARHGVQVVAAAYEGHEELGEVPLMVTKHCVRFSLSLCPKQAKGVTGVQGTVRAEPLQLVSAGETLTLRFDCKPCEMHVVGKIRKSVLRETAAQPLTFYRTRPKPVAAA
jgi:collagenase-like PrtC family protease